MKQFRSDIIFASLACAVVTLIVISLQTIS